MMYARKLSTPYKSLNVDTKILCQTQLSFEGNWATTAVTLKLCECVPRLTQTFFGRVFAKPRFRLCFSFYLEYFSLNFSKIAHFPKLTIFAT